jgi:hypothetical protein
MELSLFSFGFCQFFHLDLGNLYLKCIVFSSHQFEKDPSLLCLKNPISQTLIIQSIFQSKNGSLFAYFIHENVLILTACGFYSFLNA